MKTTHYIFYVTKKEALFYNEMCQLTTADVLFKTDEIIAYKKFELTDHLHFYVKLINGDDEGSPYVEPALFKHDAETCIFHSTNQLTGEYHFDFDDQSYQVNIIAK